MAGACAAAAALVAGACADRDDPRITLVPATEVAGGSWDWTADCRVGPRTASGCDPAGPITGTGQLVGNAWNLGGAGQGTGTVGMAVDDEGTLLMTGALTSAPPCTAPDCLAPEANTWVRGFPSVLYGIDQCNAATSPPRSPDLPVPARLADLPDTLAATTTYVAEAAEITYTVAYDLWLNPSDTETPCRTQGTLEVMVWTDYDAESLLPESMKVGRATVPFAVNGEASPGDQAWDVYVANVFEAGRTQPWGGTVWLVLDPASVVRNGTVSVDLRAALDAVATLLETNYGWTDVAAGYWLNTITFGIEYGPADGDPWGDGPIDFRLTVSSFCLQPGTSVADARC